MNHKRMIPFYACILILAYFAVHYLSTGNYEFMVYIVSIGALTGVLMWSDKYVKYLALGKWGYTIWLLGHMLGGTLKINGTKLYGTIIINWLGEPFNILRFDQAIHFYLYLVMPILLYSIIKWAVRIKNYENTKKWVVGIIIVLAAIGIGAINEIIEFFITVYYAGSGVGDYYNNSIDLIFNALGAITGTIIVMMKK
ncbi:hypothetical protein COU61_01065 [Candidatus Pacearchaeota archaeon CG10_big_fil_rev_8_21_14_0_10_35_13]|nr:MAG: hypothetical protein COU61_01065 [Candidatus Pacearchaeota archaeon CG10_big_fil_rev_8_21_14_0_10_35_13]